MQPQGSQHPGAAAAAAAAPAASSDDLYGAYKDADSEAALEAARALWAQVKEVESVVVTAIVDNETDGLSTPCACCDPALDPDTRTPYASEFTAGIQVWGHYLCWKITRGRCVFVWLLGAMGRSGG